MFPGAGKMKVGGGLGSEGMLLSVLGCGPIAGFQDILPWKKIRNFDVQRSHDPGGHGVTPSVGYISMCRPKR